MFEEPLCFGVQIVIGVAFCFVVHILWAYFVVNKFGLPWCHSHIELRLIEVEVD